MDEICVISPTTCRDPKHCGGPESGVHCADFLTRAQAFEVQFCKDIQVLGFETNHKDVPPMLSAVLLSTGFHTPTMECWKRNMECQLWNAGWPEKAAAFPHLCRYVEDIDPHEARGGSVVWFRPHQLVATGSKSPQNECQHEIYN